MPQSPLSPLRSAIYPLGALVKLPMVAHQVATRPQVANLPYIRASGTVVESDWIQNVGIEPLVAACRRLLVRAGIAALDPGAAAAQTERVSSRVGSFPRGRGVARG